MKTKKITVGLLAHLLAAAMLFTACTKPAEGPSGAPGQLPHTDAGAASSEKAEAQQMTESEVWEIAKDACTFVFPLVMMGATMKASTNTETATATQAPANQLIHTRQLANAQNKMVVTPNVDTVYSQAYFDLSQDAIVLRKPQTERYCIMNP